jgi:pimeloyl-ACP methyl ester carboxylesterase
VKTIAFTWVLILVIVASSYLSSLFLPSLETIYVDALTSIDQSVKQSQDDLQSAINNQVNQSMSDTISYITNNNSNLGVINTSSNSQENRNSITTFQQNDTNIDSMSLQRISVGDIDIAYKSFGNGEPIFLISGSGNIMDSWPTYFLKELSKDHKVFIFDNRGVGNTSAGTKQFSIDLFANDTAGLMNALKIQKADVLGFSMGSFIAQKLVLNHPEKVNRLILYGASCGGAENVPQTPQVIKALSDFVNNKTTDEGSFLEVTFPPQWIKDNPSFLEAVPKSSEIILSSTLKKQFELNEGWLSKNWTGVCDQLKNMTKPTLIISGTEDIAVPSANSLVLVDKIPGAWLLQIRDAGHGLMYQYPKDFTDVVKTFLNISNSTN